MSIVGAKLNDAKREKTEREMRGHLGSLEVGVGLVDVAAETEVRHFDFLQI